MEFAGNVVTDLFDGRLGKTLPLNKNENAELNIFLLLFRYVQHRFHGYENSSAYPRAYTAVQCAWHPAGCWGRR